MSKEILAITLTKIKLPKSKFSRWFYWNIYFKVWNIWRPKILSKFFKALSIEFLSLLPKEKRQTIIDEFNDIEIIIKDCTNERQM